MTWLWTALVAVVFRLRRRWPGVDELATGPRPPEDVVLVFADGRQVPVECVYAGRDAAGLHVWRAVWPYAGRPESLHVRVLPGETRVEVACLFPPSA